jgi:xylulose-5-phosphate/fructose-6-phosphate phosphoketolase
MVARNELDRYHRTSFDRVPVLGHRVAHVEQTMRDERTAHRAYIKQHGDDMPEIRDRTWTAP